MAKEKTAVRPFGVRDKVGYMFGDFGNDFTFLLSSSWMLKFYTDVMGVNAGIVGILMMCARFVDAFTDVTMGQIVDHSKVTKAGKFKPWIKRMCGPVAIASFLIYQSEFAGMPMTFKIIWMVVTYILWGSIFYTSVNIPYGSMASAISDDPTDRSQLSTWRTMGSTCANIVINVVCPLVVYNTVDGNQVLSGTKMTILAGIFSICAIVCYLLCYNLVTERVEVPQKTEKFSFKKLFKTLFSSRALIGIILAAICLLLGQLGMSTMATYVFPNFYGNTTAQSASSFIGAIAMMVICAPTATKISQKIGKKELSIISCLVGAGAFLVCLILRPSNVWVYVAFFAVAYVGLGYFNFVIWAMITDVIDDSEIRQGVREDGTIYSVYSFARKLGQALASGLTGVALSAIGYTTETAFDTEVVNGIFTLSCLFPIIGLGLVAVMLAFVYPLGKKKVEENNAILAAKHKNQANK